MPPLRENVVTIALKETVCVARKGDKSVRRTICPGDIAILPAQQGGHWEWDNPVDALHLRMSTNWLGHLAAQNGIGTLELMPSCGVVDARIEHIGLALLSEVEAGCPNGRLFGDNLMTALATHLLDRYAVVSHKLTDRRGKLSPPELKCAIQFICDRLENELSLTQIGNAVGYSSSHFSHLFKASTGQTPFQFVRERRLERAYALLCKKTYNVAQIAQMTGFSDSGHLCREFKKRYGVTPTQI